MNDQWSNQMQVGCLQLNALDISSGVMQTAQLCTRAHLQAGDDGEAAHKLRDEAVVDEVGLLHLLQHV